MKFLHRFPAVVTIALAVQFILGTYVAMYVEFPQNGSLVQNWEFARTSIPLLCHIFLGILIFLSALAYLIITLAKKKRQLTQYAIWGFVAVLAAFAGGERFVSSQDDGYSMLMAIGFISSILIYGAATRVKVDQKK